jgi:deoxyribodipyrimidine photo-lyase
LRALDASLSECGSRLILARGPATAALSALARQTKATAVYCSRRYEPAARACTAQVEQALGKQKVAFETFNSTLLAEPEDVRNLSGKPYRVYTPYLRRLLRDLKPAQPLPAPSKLRAPRTWPKSAPLESLRLLPKIKWYATMEKTWTPGEAGAQARFARFKKRALMEYREARERPAVRGTSGLSPHLHFGEMGPRQLWHALGAKGRGSTFLREIIWREFAYHLLYHFPDTTKRPLRPEFERFAWRKNARHLRAWQRGRTGVPLVDAGMRELWATGVMHNRVRMIAGSFLVKNLLQPWQEGARWFWDTLIDADLASNTLNWQWIAGSGADAAPYFRIFNPVTQGKRFDAEGAYVRQWVPEVAGRPARALHDPYGTPVVELRASREAALDAYAEMRRGRKVRPA